MKTDISNIENKVKQQKPDGYLLFQENKKLIKWCTPSVFPEVLEAFDIYSEGSIVIDKLGILQKNEGIFEKIHNRAARIYKNKEGHSHFCCEGTTGSNRILLDLIGTIFRKKGFDDKAHILATRNIHQSVVINAMKNRIPIRYIKTELERETQIFLPPTYNDIEEEIDDDTKVVLITNPTYEGLSCDLRAIVDKIREKHPSVLIYIDEAWGGHLAFHPDLPQSGTEVEADFVVQSMHKHGGAPNPSSIIHLNKRIKTDYMEEFLKSCVENTSTTYSYPLLGAMDYAMDILEREGKKRIDEMIKIADKFRSEAANIKGIKVINPKNFDNERIYNCDPTEILLNVTDTGHTGNEISKMLEEKGIVTSGEQVSSLTFLTTFLLNENHVLRTINAISQVIEELNKNKQVQTETRPAKKIICPTFPEKLEKVYNTYDVCYDVKRFKYKRVKLEESAGEVLAENIKCYPPGVFIGQMGEKIDETLIRYLLFLRDNHAHVEAIDKDLVEIKIIDK